MKLIKFGAKWCAPCQAMKKAKTAEKLAEKYGLSLAVYDTDDEHGRAVSDRMKVEILPTVVLADNRGSELTRREGGATLAMLEKAFAKHLPKI